MQHSAVEACVLLGVLLVTLGVQAVALSIVLPTGDAGLIRSLTEIRDGLPSDVPLFLGGAAVDADPERFRKLGARIIDSMSAFRASLRDLKQLAT